jgi:hypothetical protein
MAAAAGTGRGAAAGSAAEVTTVQRYDPSRMPADATILFVGPRRTGKSTLVMDMLYYLRHKIYATLVQTPTATTAEELSKIVPWSCIHDDFCPRQLESAVNAMKQLVNTERKLAHKSGRKPERRMLLILLDDCMADPKNIKQKVIQDIFFNGRHYDLLFINVQQYMMDMPAKLRTNIDIVVSTYDNRPDNQERLWKYFFKSAFPRLDRFKRVYEAATQNFGALILDGTLRGVPDHKKVFWYKAQCPAPVYRLGHVSQWVMHCSYLRSRAEELRGNIAYISETVRKAAAGGDGTAEEAAAEARAVAAAGGGSSMAGDALVVM